MQRVILVKTCQKFIARREACEATWVSMLRREGIPVFFAVGGPVESFDGYTIQTASGDDYNDNSFKVRDAVRAMLERFAFERLFICDDNTFVHPGRWLAHSPDDFEGLMTAKIPHVHGGGGWWMSRDHCGLYVAGIKRRCSWDDQLATEILTARHKIGMVNRPDLYAQWDERVAADNSLITCHNVSEKEMVELFNETNRACDKILV